MELRFIAVSDFLSHLQNFSSFSFHRPFAQNLSAGEKEKMPTDETGKIKIVSVGEINAELLKHYLKKRAIPVEIANRFCKEVCFELYHKKYTALGFENRSGGYELRNENFKGSSSPKEVSFIDNKAENMVVLEGLFSFLSFQTINKNPEAPTTNCPVLNSLAFFEKNRPVMEQYKQIHLLLDNDAAGKAASAKALQWSSKYVNRSDYYKRFKDLNDWPVADRRQQQLPKKRMGRGL